MTNIFTTNILLGIIVFTSLVRLYLIQRKTTNKSYFRGKLRTVENNILDMEFKIFKTREVREGVRRDRDDKHMKLEALDLNIEKTAKDGGLSEETIKEVLKEVKIADAFEAKLTSKAIFKKEEIEGFKRFIDQKDLLERDIKRYEDQMDMLDKQINGTPANQENPVGSAGDNDQLDSLIELRAMLVDWIKKL